jgi:ankyrin repeat protein
VPRLRRTAGSTPDAIWIACRDSLFIGHNVTRLSRSGVTALHLSSIQGHAETCKLLVELKSDINARDHRCNLCGFQNLHIESAFENDFSLLYFYSQKTALHLCVENDQVEVFRLLLAANANVDARDVEYE